MGKLQCSAVGSSGSSKQRAGTGDGAGDGDGGTFGQTTSRRPGTDWIRKQEQEQELETENWTGLGWDRIGQDRTGRDKPQHAPGLTGQVRTGRGTNELGFWHVCGFERGGSWRDGGRKCRNRGPSENSEKESSVRMGEGGRRQ